MTKDSIYINILRIGLELAKSATERGEWEYTEKLVVHLHNIPSLLNEPNINRHIYYCSIEMKAFASWIRGSTNELAIEHLDRHFIPCWQNLKDILIQERDQQENAKS